MAGRGCPCRPDPVYGMEAVSPRCRRALGPRAAAHAGKPVLGDSVQPASTRHPQPARAPRITSQICKGPTPLAGGLPPPPPRHTGWEGRAPAQAGSRWSHLKSVRPAKVLSA